MKLVAHSLVPSNPLPYMHLGYVSAVNNWYTGKADLIASLFAFAVVGLVVMVSFRKRLLVALVGAALLLGGVGGIGVIRWQAGSTRTYLHPEWATRSALRTVQLAIDISYAQDAPLPKDNATLMRVLALDPKQYRDGWFRAVRYVPGRAHGALRYQVVSAGKDGRFGTADDYTLNSDHQGKISYHEPRDPHDQ